MQWFFAHSWTFSSSRIKLEFVKAILTVFRANIEKNRIYRFRSLNCVFKCDNLYESLLFVFSLRFGFVALVFRRTKNVETQKIGKIKRKGFTSRGKVWLPSRLISRYSFNRSILRSYYIHMYIYINMYFVVFVFFAGLIQ